MKPNEKYNKELLTEAVKSNVSYAGVLRYLGLAQAGGTQSWIKKRITDLSIDTSHFTGKAHGKGKPSSSKKTASTILIQLPAGSHRPKREQLLRALEEIGVKYKCSSCGQGNSWFGKKLVLEIDHIDGSWLNNLKSNLRFLCPNCHSQQTITNKPNKYK